jgi:hypothetical protein
MVMSDHKDQIFDPWIEIPNGNYPCGRPSGAF